MLALLLVALLPRGLGMLLGTGATLLACCALFLELMSVAFLTKLST